MSQYRIIKNIDGTFDVQRKLFIFGWSSECSVLEPLPRSLECAERRLRLITADKKFEVVKEYTFNIFK